MLRRVKKLIPQPLINLGGHLPRAVLANLSYGFPGRKVKVIGVTGTDGKTTTVNMIYKILKDAGKSVSMISTINAQTGGKSYDTGFHVTTPSPFMIQKFLNQAKVAGDQYMVLEVTSHSLDQFRVWGIRFDIGVITNITHEHLDYHGSFDNYLNAKARLIRGVRYAILNRDDPPYQKLIQKTSSKIISFGLTQAADFNPHTFPLKLKIPGKYNLLNAEASAAVGVSLGIAKKNIKQSLESFGGLTGRMEEIKNNLDIKIVVDFAHTPNALENALQTLKSQSRGRLISVFGCASERDIQKRPLMGKISGKFADITVLTDEDPRFEDSMKIIEEIAKGARLSGAKEGTNLFFEPNRQQAIIQALKMARRGDTIGIFGKGHERSINYNGVETPWSDQEAVAHALKQAN